jgi:hypothetical protein
LIHFYKRRDIEKEIINSKLVCQTCILLIHSGRKYIGRETIISRENKQTKEGKNILEKKRKEFIWKLFGTYLENDDKWLGGTLEC